MRLIDADALKKLWCEDCDNKHFCNEEIYCDSVKQLYEQPTVDAVEVVRCKDCKFINECLLYSSTSDKNGYCVLGERREDANS